MSDYGSTWDPDYLPEAARRLLAVDDGQRELASIEAWRQLGFWAALYLRPWGAPRVEGDR